MRLVLFVRSCSGSHMDLALALEEEGAVAEVVEGAGAFVEEIIEEGEEGQAHEEEEDGELVDHAHAEGMGREGRGAMGIKERLRSRFRSPKRSKK